MSGLLLPLRRRPTAAHPQRATVTVRGTTATFTDPADALAALTLPGEFARPAARRYLAEFPAAPAEIAAARAARRPRILDLFCCAGGASAGYERAGFEVFGVDKDPQPDYPFAFHQGDALEVMRRLLAGEALAFTHRDGSVELLRLEDFDAIAGSPPCQFFTAYRRKGHGVGDGYLNLIPETREALIATGLPYIIENVAGAPLLDPVQLCGSSFGLDVRRHRLFDSNVPLLALPCDHSWQTPRFAPATNRTNLRRTVEVGAWRIPLDVQQRAMGIDWMPLRQLSEAIPPAYTEFIGLQLIDHLNHENTAALAEGSRA